MLVPVPFFGQKILKAILFFKVYFNTLCATKIMWSNISPRRQDLWISGFCRALIQWIGSEKKKRERAYIVYIVDENV